MRKLCILLAALLLTLAVGAPGCRLDENLNPGGGNDTEQGGGDEPEEKDPPPGEDGDNKDENGDNDDKDDLPEYTFTWDGGLAEAARDKQASVNALSATDDFGRGFGYTDGFKTDKYVCLFYFAWLGQETREMNGTYDISRLLESNAVALWNTDGTPESPLGQYHFWGEPLYGYYNSLDPWVIRRHVELFISAGIDCLVFDATNAHCYFPVIDQIAKILLAYLNRGWNVPKFMFYTNTNSNSTVRMLYRGTGNPSAHWLEHEGIYQNGNYKRLWFAPEGKPQIVAVTEGLDAELKNFFDVWESTWPSGTTLGEPYLSNGFPWIDWTGAPGHKGTQTMTGMSKGGVMSVSVAQHNRAPFSNAINTFNKCNIAEEQKYMWGRGYTRKNKANHTDEAINSGLNFEEEWELALSKNPKYVHVTGWNEWVALKSVSSALPNAGAYFVDQANREYSRDAEMMKGGYADNFYLQIARNVRSYKGLSGTQSAGAKKTIDIKSGLVQWNGVTCVYDDFTITDIIRKPTEEVSDLAAYRNFKNFAGTATLTDDTLKNDIKSVRVTNDEENIYFLVECVNDISGAPLSSGNRFMNLLISVDGQDGGNSLGGFSYMVNRRSSETGVCSVEKIGKSGSKLAYVQTGAGGFSLNGKYMQFCISKQSLGIGKNVKFNIGFKVADNVTDPEDMQSYYVSGECAPVGRLGYSYTGN